MLQRSTACCRARGRSKGLVAAVADVGIARDHSSNAWVHKPKHLLS